jgi:hypothetical protein
MEQVVIPLAAAIGTIGLLNCTGNLVVTLMKSMQLFIQVLDAQEIIGECRPGLILSAQRRSF